MHPSVAARPKDRRREEERTMEHFSEAAIDDLQAAVVPNQDEGELGEVAEGTEDDVGVIEQSIEL
jgi:hypothetical protein